MYKVLLLILISTTCWARQLNVIVDPGHGGSDTGAVSGSLKESEIVLNISKHLVRLLENDRRFTAYMTRLNDQLLSLDDRTKVAEIQKADVFVSVHVNSSTSPKPRGVEIYFQNQMPPDEESLYLANRENEGLKVSSSTEKPKGDLAAILDDLRRQNQIHLSFGLAKDIFRAYPKSSRPRIRQAPFHVLSEVKIPSVLIETGFLTNPQDAAQLSKISHQKEIAALIFKGLESFYARWSKGHTIAQNN